MSKGSAAINRNFVTIATTAAAAATATEREGSDGGSKVREPQDRKSVV